MCVGLSAADGDAVLSQPRRGSGQLLSAAQELLDTQGDHAASHQEPHAPVPTACTPRVDQVTAATSPRAANAARGSRHGRTAPGSRSVLPVQSLRPRAVATQVRAANAW